MSDEFREVRMDRIIDPGVGKVDIIAMSHDAGDVDFVAHKLDLLDDESRREVDALMVELGLVVEDISF